MSVSLPNSTKLRLCIIAILVAVVPLVIFTIYARDAYRDSIIEVQGRRFQQEALRILDSVGVLIEQRKVDVVKFSQNTRLTASVASGDLGAASSVLAELRKRYGAYSSISIVDAKDNIIASSQSNLIGQSVAKEAWILSARNAKVYHGERFPGDASDVPVSVSGVVYDSLSSSYRINFSIALVGDGIAEDNGFLLVSCLHWSELFEKVNALSIREGGNGNGAFAVLYDDRHNVIAGPGFLLKDNARSSSVEVLFSKNIVPVNPFIVGARQRAETSMGAKLNGSVAQNQAIQDTTFSILPAVNGVEYLVGVAMPEQSQHNRNLGWSVAVMQTKDAVLSTSYKVISLSKIVIAITVFTVVFVLFLLIRGADKQIRQYGNVIEAVKAGDYSNTVPDVENDIGGLGVYLNEMSRVLGKQWSSMIAEKQAISAADQAKSELVAHIGQELRAPLHGIIEIADVVMESASTNEQRSCAKNIVRAATSLLSVAHNMVDVNLLQHSRQALVARPYDLNALVGEVTEVLALASAHRGVDLISYYSPQCPRYFIGHPARVQQIITNMAYHVLRSTSDNQILISVHCRESDSNSAEMWVVVESSGVGLERGNLEHLWREGVDGQPVAFEYKEIGLDLILSRQIAELVDGNLGCFGNAGSAEICWLSLSQHRDLTQNDDASRDSFDLQAKRVLIAVSNPVTGRLIEKILFHWNATCKLVHSAEHAWAELEDGIETDNPYSFLIASKCFCGDGQDFVAKVYANRKHAEIKTIFLSSLSSIFDATSFGRKAIVRIVHMPFEPDELKRALTSL